MKKNQKVRRLALFRPSGKGISSLGKNGKREGSQKVGLKKVEPKNLKEGKKPAF